MHVANIRIESGEPGKRRLVADVTYSDRSHPNGPDVVWIEVEEEHADVLSTRADAWICYLLPLAALHRQPVIRVESVASRRLVESAMSVLAIWKTWRPRMLDDIRIECDEISKTVDQRESKTGVFFSGGVDSWYTLLHEDKHGTGVDSLVPVMGWDIPLSNTRAVENMIRSHRDAAQSLGKSLVVVKTNMRDFRFGEGLWGPLMHGCALATVAHALSSGFARMLIAATHSPGASRAWGSHPGTDPLFSTEQTQIVHHGFPAKRIDKMHFIAEHQVALDHLHVCWRTWDETNCGKCEKCLRTILALELLGVLDRAKTFSIDRVRPEDYNRVKAVSPGVREWLRELQVLAEEQGRTDMAHALERCSRRGRTYAWLKSCVPEAIGAPDGLLGKPLRALWKRI